MERIDEQRAELLTERRAARLAREDERYVRVRQVFVKEPDLRRLACALDALEGDEEPAVYWAGSLNTRTRRFGSVPVERDSRRYFSAS